MDVSCSKQPYKTDVHIWFGNKNGSDILPILVTAHIPMEAVTSLPWEGLQVPLAVSHLKLQSLSGTMRYLFHAIGAWDEIMWVITLIGFVW